jgi:hypothetical protein
VPPILLGIVVVVRQLSIQTRRNCFQIDVDISCRLSVSWLDQRRGGVPLLLLLLLLLLLEKTD